MRLENLRKVILEIFDRPITNETEMNLRALIDEYKNERSWLQSIQMNLCTNSNPKAYSGFVVHETLSLYAKEEE